MSILELLAKAGSMLLDGFVIALAVFGMWGAGSLILEYVHLPVTADTVFVLFFALCFGFFWTPLAWLIMGRVAPEGLVDRYLTTSNFSAAEVVCASAVSLLLPFPTTLLMGACTLPRKWLRTRKLTDLRDHVPRWFVWCSRIVLTSAMVHFVLTIGLLIGLSVYHEIFAS